MKTILFSALLICLCVTSCNTGVDSVAWNKNLVEAHNKTMDQIEDFQELISPASLGDTAVNRQLESVATIAVADIEKALKHLSEGEIPSNGDLCKAAAIEMLTSAKSQLEIGMKFTSFTEETPETDIEKYADEYDEASIATAKKVDAFTTAQKQFAEDEKIGFE